jgi:hypothetical protein
MRLTCLTIFLILLRINSFSQNNIDIDKLLTRLEGQSEFITKDSLVVKLLKKGVYALPLLSLEFTNRTRSKVYSKCVGDFLTKGELAIILADRIEGMPYFTLTGIQNCTLESCNNNPNFIEYYLTLIRSQGMALTFQKRYNEWLLSSERRRSRN